MRYVLGYLALVAGLPLAIIAMVQPVNEYRDMGISAVDCDGPGSVIMMSLPALLIYGGGAILFYRSAGTRLQIAPALCCLAIFFAVAVHVAEAAREMIQTDIAQICT